MCNKKLSSLNQYLNNCFFIQIVKISTAQRGKCWVISQVFAIAIDDFIRFRFAINDGHPKRGWISTHSSEKCHYRYKREEEDEEY